jgi:transcriptional regulator with XRE-family HTH domain/tetratricopeptide (TPR) repeat protein
VTFGEFLRRYRREALLTQEELAERARLSVRTVRDLENSRVCQPRDHTVRAMAQALALTDDRRQQFVRLARQGVAPASADQTLVRQAVAPDSTGRIPSGSGRTPDAAPCLLPSDDVNFCGRGAEIHRLRHAVGTPGAGSATTVVALGGPAGVGKSALAVHVAHLLRQDYPDGQLFADLGGTAEAPVPASQVLSYFLHALLGYGTTLPTSSQERIHLYRTTLAGRRVLVVLDDAANESQVRDLIPAVAGSAVVVTGRRTLTTIGATATLCLETLGTTESLTLLGRAAGSDRVLAEPAAAEQIVRQCSGLPLALRIAGARLDQHQDWPLSALAARLMDERQRLNELAVGDLGVRTSIHLSYRTLGDDERALFRLLPLIGARRISPDTAGAAADLSPETTEKVIGRLLDAHLLDVVSPGCGQQRRYRMPPLVQAFARERSEHEDSPLRRSTALRRALWRGLEVLVTAHRRLPTSSIDLPCWSLEDSPPGPPGVDFSDSPGPAVNDPLRWFDLEYPSLLFAVEQAVVFGEDALAWRLVAALGEFLELRGHLEELERIGRVGLAAAERCNDLPGVALLSRIMGEACAMIDQHQSAANFFVNSARAYRAASDPLGEAHARHYSAVMKWWRGDTGIALEEEERALGIFTDLGDPSGQARVIQHLGLIHLERAIDRSAPDYGAAAGLEPTFGGLNWVRGEVARAIPLLERSVELFYELGDRRGQALALVGVGQAVAARGHLGRARAWILRGLAVSDAFDYRPGQIRTMLALANLDLAEGRPGPARNSLARCTELIRPASDLRPKAMALQTLSRLECAENNFDQALHHILSSVRLWAEVRRPAMQAHALATLAVVHDHRGEPQRADDARRRAGAVLSRSSIRTT